MPHQEQLLCCWEMGNHTNVLARRMSSRGRLLWALVTLCEHSPREQTLPGLMGMQVSREYGLGNTSESHLECVPALRQEQLWHL